MIMAERIARLPIRLGAGLPDGQLLGATDRDVSGFLVDNPEGDVIDRYAIVRVVRRSVVHSDETGADIALLRVAALEFVPDDVVPAIPEKLPAGTWMAQLRSERLGENTLDFASAAAAESLTDLRAKVDQWAAESEVPAAELAAEVRKLVPNVPDGVDVLRDPQVLSEFLTLLREREDDEFDQAIADTKVNAKPKRGAKVKETKEPAAVPGAEFSDPEPPELPNEPTPLDGE